MNQKSIHLLEWFSDSSLIPHPSSLVSSFIPHPSSLLSLLLLLGASFVVVCVVVAAWLHHRKGAGGASQLDGRIALVMQALEPEGAVLVGGELWRARARNGDRIARGRVRMGGGRGRGGGGGGGGGRGR